MLGLVAGVSGGFGARMLAAIAVGLLVSVASYRLAVLATDEWAAAVRALVDHGRKGVADAFGLTIPADLAEERLMWRAVNTLVRRPYTYSESRDVGGVLKRFRGKDSAESASDRQPSRDGALRSTTPSEARPAWLTGILNRIRGDDTTGTSRD
jgi:hypothetical protein